MAKKRNRKTEVIHPKRLAPYVRLSPEDTTKQNISSKINWNIRRLKGMQAQLLSLDADLRECQTLLGNFHVKSPDLDSDMLYVISRQRHVLQDLGPRLAKLIHLTYAMQGVLGREVMGKETLEDIEREKDHGPF